jgi:WD40 repeat protein
LLDGDTNNLCQGGEIFACDYTPDEGFVLTAGWDGTLRLWDAARGAKVHEIHVGSKPLSACAVMPDGTRWVSGSMDGMLAQWEPASQQRLSIFLAHTRPISAIVFSSDGNAATASWDGQVIVWTIGQQWEGRPLVGHRDIVSGCRFTPDGKSVVSWSYDGSLRLWELARNRCLAELRGHNDRITAGGMCPNGKWLSSGARNGVLKLWSLETGMEVKSATLESEIRACLFPLDGESLITVESNGRVALHSVPDLELLAELATRLAVQCADITPSGSQLALGCGDGQVRFAALEGYDHVPLLVTPTQTSRLQATLLQRLFGKSRVIFAYECTCPVCRQSFELPGTSPGQTAPCPYCRRHLRISSLMRTTEKRAAVR